jgi:glycerol-3-phosphate acyltransferase PlsY
MFPIFPGRRDGDHIVAGAPGSPGSLKSRCLPLFAAYAAGSLPVAQIAARLLARADLRRVGSGTVSASGLYEVAGFGPLVAVGLAELAKGACGPLIVRRTAGPGDVLAGAAAGAAAVAGHNWSPWLRGAGGRGIGVVLGVTAVVAPEATVVLGASFGVGRVLRQSGLGCAAGMALVPCAMCWRRGRAGLVGGLALTLPMWAKRLAGNGRPDGGLRPGVLARRALFDRESVSQ